MGVHGLTTYLRENQRTLSTRLNLPARLHDPIPIVIDGWSFIYDLHRNSNLPWVYGGEYDQFSKLVAAVVQAWIKVRLKVYFVFDGACPELKFSTQVSRLGQSHVQPSLLFFRTSPTSRGTARFLNETRIIPPLVYTACIHALKAVQKTTDAVEVHFADEEGDPYAVELAGMIGGYVAGNDSDFVVLNTEGYRGYIPLEEMIWYAPVSAETPSHEADSEFQEVRKPKAKRRPVNEAGVGRGIIPPDAEGLTLSLTVYQPVMLAAHLKIPVTLLPLLGALLGNDFSTQSELNRRSAQSLFFDKQLSLSQRINLVASTIQTTLSPVAQKRKKQNHQVSGVMDFIDRVVNALLARLIKTIGSGEIEDIVDKIVKATLQYAITRREDNTLGVGGLWPSRVCALHEPDTCPLLPLVSRRIAIVDEVSEDEDNQIQDTITLRAQYVDAYRQGHLSPKIMDILGSSTFWPRLFLENPDFETVSRSIGRPIREWIYSILHDAVGLPEPLEVESEDEIEEAELGDEDEDELVDVVESGSEDGEDLLAPLKGALHRLHSSDDEGPGTSAASSTSYPPRPSRPPIVTEYLRRGTRVAQEAVTVRPLYELLASISLPESDTHSPALLPSRSSEEKLTVVLRALESDVPPVRALPSEQILPVLAIRWVLRRIHFRAEETKSNEREKERWTKREVTCFLASFHWTASLIPVAQEPTPILDRNVQLMAQALQALESVEFLSQVLLLTDALPPSVHLLSSRAFHGYLAGGSAVDQATVSPALIEAASYGLEFAYGEDRYTRKSKKATGKTPVPSRTFKGPEGGGLFKLLADMDA